MRRRCVGEKGAADAPRARGPYLLARVSQPVHSPAKGRVRDGDARLEDELCSVILERCSRCLDEQADDVHVVGVGDLPPIPVVSPLPLMGLHPAGRLIACQHITHVVCRDIQPGVSIADVGDVLIIPVIAHDHPPREVLAVSGRHGARVPPEGPTTPQTACAAKVMKEQKS